MGDWCHVEGGSGRLVACSGLTGAVLWSQAAGVGTVGVIGDLDGDGLSDVGAGRLSSLGFVQLRAGADGTTLGSFSGSLPGAGFGRAVAAAGDVDLDGFLDVAVGSPDYDNLALLAGDVGRVELSLDPLGADRRRSWIGVHPGARLGESLAGGFDANGDGLPDLVAGAPGKNELNGGASVLSPRAQATTPFGTGTAGCAGDHLLVASAVPRVGEPLVLRTNRAEPGAPSLLGLSLGDDPDGTDLGLGFLVHLDVLGLVLTQSGAADGAGTAAHPLAVPDDAALAGLALFAQCVLAGTPGACGLPLGLSSSEGLAFVIQP